MIAGIARETHAAPFTIPRESAACHYWVMTWAPGEGVSRISLRDIDSEREQALSAFETWLAGNGYLQKTGGGFYDIRGSSVFPIKTVLLGSRPGEVERELGKPPLVLTGNFREPAIVRLEDLPAFDLQWGYPEKNAASWVFFKQQKVVAAFREVMD
jgi:hypothetical protein